MYHIQFEFYVQLWCLLHDQIMIIQVHAIEIWLLASKHCLPGLAWPGCTGCTGCTCMYVQFHYLTKVLLLVATTYIANPC